MKIKGKKKAEQKYWQAQGITAVKGPPPTENFIWTKDVLFTSHIEADSIVCNCYLVLHVFTMCYICNVYQWCVLGVSTSVTSNT